MGATLILSAFLLKGLLGINMQNQGALQLAYPVLILAGAFAAINGANIRSLVLNLTSPEARTAVIAFLNVVNCVGRGIGPAVMEFYIDYFGASRLESMIMILNLWSIAGLMICLVGVTIVRDEESMKNNIMNIVSGLPLLY